MIQKMLIQCTCNCKWNVYTKMVNCVYVKHFKNVKDSLVELEYDFKFDSRFQEWLKNSTLISGYNRTSYIVGNLKLFILVYNYNKKCILLFLYVIRTKLFCFLWMNNTHFVLQLYLELSKSWKKNNHTHTC